MVNVVYTQDLQAQMIKIKLEKSEGKIGTLFT